MRLPQGEPHQNGRRSDRQLTASSRACTSIRFSSLLLISTIPIGSAASKPHATRREKTDSSTLLSADILAWRLPFRFADPLLWNFSRDVFNWHIK
jgi:hypothetical protein